MECARASVEHVAPNNPLPAEFSVGDVGRLAVALLLDALRLCPAVLSAHPSSLAPNDLLEAGEGL